MTKQESPPLATTTADRSIERAPATTLGVKVHDAADPPRMTVAAFLAHIAQLLRAKLPRQIWLEASVVGVRASRFGHTLELADPVAGQGTTLRAFLPSEGLRAIRGEVGSTFDPALLAGMTTVVLVEPKFDLRWHLGARVVSLARSGAMSLRRRMVEQAVAELKRDGLWDRQRRLSAPRDVTRVAVVHPAGAAGWADVVARLARWQKADLLAVRSIVAPFEGDRAAAALVQALTKAAAPGPDGQLADLVLFVRGGGAREGLAALDEEAVARAVCTCPVPVVCGTGHAVDLTLTDGCAWRRVDTPTAAAALVTGLIAAAARTAAADRLAITMRATEAVMRAERRLHATATQLHGDADRALATAAGSLAECWSRVRIATANGRGQLERLSDGATALLGNILARVPAVLEREAAALAHLHDRIGRDAVRTCTDAATMLSRAALLVEAHDPARTLDRGFVLVTDAVGRVLTFRAEAAAEPQLLLCFGDGVLAVSPDDAANAQ